MEFLANLLQGQWKEKINEGILYQAISHILFNFHRYVLGNYITMSTLQLSSER